MKQVHVKKYRENMEQKVINLSLGNQKVFAQSLMILGGAKKKKKKSSSLEYN